MSPAAVIFENCAFSTLVVWNSFFEWEIAELDCFWHKTENRQGPKLTFLGRHQLATEIFVQSP